MEQEEVAMDINKMYLTMQSLFKTEQGKEVLEAWEKMYVETTALGNTTEQTYYNLGQKEFIQFVKKVTDTHISEQQLTRGVIHE